MKLYVNAEQKKGRIHKEIYGHFSEYLGRCIYEGIYVGENSPIPNENGMRRDVVEALKEIKVPVLRWPGGCFADEYHWRDGIGPKETRKRMVNTHWGGVVEDNSFGTHEYMELCRQLGCETYVNGNLGSGTVQEMSEWVEYMTFDGVSPMAELRAKNGHSEAWKVDFFGVGNESWGCGGNMTPEFYANEYRRYQTFVRQYKGQGEIPSIDTPDMIRRICCGPNIDDTEWTRGVLKTLFRHCEEKFHGHADGLSLHYYVHPEGWDIKGSATEFTEEVYYKTLKKALYMEDLINMHATIMDQYDPEKKLGLIVDEWGTWYTVEPGTNPGFLYQQNTIRDALVAALTLNIFNAHCDRVRMANLAQMVNVLQAVLLTEGDEMVKTPTYHVFHQYVDHMDADLVESSISSPMVGKGGYEVPMVSQSVSVKEDGSLVMTLANCSAEESAPVDAVILGMPQGEICATIVSGDMHDKNTFEKPDEVTEKAFAGVERTKDGLSFSLPACSVVKILVKGA